MIPSRVRTTVLQTRAERPRSESHQDTVQRGFRVRRLGCHRSGSLGQSPQVLPSRRLTDPIGGPATPPRVPGPLFIFRKIHLYGKTKKSTHGHTTQTPTTPGQALRGQRGPRMPPRPPDRPPGPAHALQGRRATLQQPTYPAPGRLPYTAYPAAAAPNRGRGRVPPPGEKKKKKRKGKKGSDLPLHTRPALPARPPTLPGRRPTLYRLRYTCRVVVNSGRG